MKGIRDMKKMDIDDRIEIIANQLDGITDLIGFNLTVSDIKKRMMPNDNTRCKDQTNI